MSKKKFGTTVLAALLAMSLLAGCGGNEAPESDVSTGGTGASTVGTGTGDETGLATGESTAATGESGATGGEGNQNGTSGNRVVTTKGGAAGTADPDDPQPGEIIEASFTRNEDGTCTDKATGVIFLDDDLDNWNKMHERGSELQTDSNEAALMEGDSVRVLRSGTGKDSWFTYKLESGITEVGLIAYYAGEDGGTTFKEGLTLQVSKDNKTWTTLKPETQDVGLGFNWYKRTYTVKGIDKSNIYFKVTFNPAGSISYNPNVGRLRINNIDKMNDNDRYLENRASATFYVDSKNGSDRNDGLSPETAFKSLFMVSSKFFQPGDQVLFKRGETYSGALTIKGYGTESNPILFGTYGEGDKPVISARGGTAVMIKATYITFDGFEITNPNGLMGINVIPAQAGANKNITISNCYIHDINYTKEDEFTYEGSGGIIVYADNVEPVWFENMVVTNNTIEKTSRMGILYTTQWAYRPGRWGKNTEGTEYAYKNDNENWFVFLNSSISNNTVTDVRGDGIMACGAKGLVIERNVVYNAYSTEKNASGTAAAGLWTTNTNDSVIQYNEVGYTKLPAGGTDGDGYDIDISEVNTTLQYNYSHNNEGGFLLICNSGDGNNISKNAVVRYNLSVNDGGKGNTGYFIITQQNPGTQIYNNTFFSNKPGVHVSMIHIFGGTGTTPKDFTFTNNIFASVAGGDCTMTSALDGSNGVFANSVENFKFVNNIFYNVTAPTTGGGVTVSGSKTVDPGFTVKSWTEAEFKNMEAMIKNFVPNSSIGRPSFVSGDPKKDIAGETLTSAIYGAVKY